MKSLGIVLLCIGCASAYGVVHDQVTVRLCLEYFTIGHPPIFATKDPTLLAFCWGVFATWWVGLLLGVPLALAALWGCRAQRSILSLIKPISWLLLVMALCATLAGVAGWLLAKEGHIYLVGGLAEDVPRDKHNAFLAALWAHSTSYLVGFVGGLVVIVRVWNSRFPRSGKE